MLHRNSVRIATGTLAMLAAMSLAGRPSRADVPKAKEYSDPRELRISPRSAPVPALKYRLLPMESTRTPGDAAPVYMRPGISATEEGKREIEKKSIEWANLPLDQLPIADVRKFVGDWAGSLHQLEFGARRRTCDWNYTLAEQKEQVLDLRLPDAQVMRIWARLQVIDARLKIAEHRFDEAVRSIETGVALGRHVSTGPFVINALIGVACAQVMFGCVEELMAQPDAPNLYWALTALPRPLVSVREALEIEEVIPEWVIPELAEVDRPHDAAGWTSLLGRLHDRMKDLETKIVIIDGTVVGPATKNFTDLVTFRARALGPARAYVKARRGSIEGLTDDQVIVLHVAGGYREFYDDRFKAAYLPYPEAVAAEPSPEQLKAVEGGPLGLFAGLIPNVTAIRHAEARLDRTVASLRVIEALRLHAADRGGLPGSLAEITIVPIPLDPVTGKAFEYRREGEGAVLVGPESDPKLVLTYRIHLR
jgi:hypothetical protein